MKLFQLKKSQVSDSTIQAIDISLLSTASRYNLKDNKEKERSNKDLESLFFELNKIIKPNVFIEAGAKDAYASVKIKEILPDVKTIAFEANPHNHKYYKDKLTKVGVDYRNIALSDKVNDKIDFFIHKDKDGELIIDGKSSLLMKPDHAHGYEKISVNTTTIDDAVGLDAGSYSLWVDVEGASGTVLSGASQILNMSDIALVEVEDREYWAGQSLKHEIDALFARNSFMPVARDFQYTYQYNQIYLKTKHLKDHLVRRSILEHYSKSGSK